MLGGGGGGGAAITTRGSASPATEPASTVLASNRSTVLWYRMSRRTGPRLCAALVLTLVACPAASRKPPPRLSVTVFAAASLGESFRAIEGVYEAEHPEIDVVLNFAGSQLLAMQLIEGASADVFASADAATLDRVLAERPAVADTRRAFASNKLVIVVARDSDVDTFDEVHELLNRPNVKAVLAGPDVPVGRYARKALDELGLREAFDAKLVSNEDSVDGVLAKLQLGECDIGITYATDLRRSDELRGIPLPDLVDVTARYELAVLADGPAPEQGQAFAAFVTGPRGQALLQERGFGP
jgi:molybdate transport system substrate-binding protein